MEALKKAEEANSALQRMRQSHYVLVEEMGHWNTTITTERDEAFKELNELKSKLFEIIKERDAANTSAKEVCDQAMVL
jgi:ArsR family metal-binding transcriptional regulator